MGGSTSADSVRDAVDLGKMKVGNQVKASTELPATASKPMYVDSSSNLAVGAIPFSVPITASSTTTSTFLTMTGTSTRSGTADMTLTFATGTTFTTVGYARVSVVDSGGNFTDGDYYVPFGTLA